MKKILFLGIGIMLLSMVNVFAQDTCVVIVLSDPPELFSPVGSGTYSCGETITLMANPIECYRFGYWRVEIVDVGIDTYESPIIHFPVTGYIIATAHYFGPITYDISLLANPPSGGTVSGGGAISCGTSATVAATPVDGYYFVNWTKDGVEVSPNSTFTILPKGDVELVANFRNLDIKEIATAVSIFPNPTTGELRITNYELRIENIAVFDVYGRKLIEQKAESRKQNEIDISNLQTGVYFIKIITEKGIITKKIIKY
jgi:hypothetical protein